MNTDPIPNTWKFVCSWYKSDEIFTAVNRLHKPVVIPSDVKSRQFADWATEQSRLAMAKGIQLAREWQADRIRELEVAIALGGFDEAACSVCGRSVVTIGDGLAVCSECLEGNE